MMTHEQALQIVLNDSQYEHLFCFLKHAPQSKTNVVCIK